jgi:hypothetical protein
MNTKVDQTALKFNQASIILLLVLAFLLDAAWLVAFVAAVMVVGTTLAQRRAVQAGVRPPAQAARLAQAQRARR